MTLEVTGLRGGITARALAAIVCVAASGASQQKPPERYGVQTELVFVDVLVVDGKDRPIAGLAAADFRVYEDGALQTIEAFDARAAEGAPPVAAAARSTVAPPTAGGAAGPGPVAAAQGRSAAPRPRMVAVVCDTRDFTLAEAASVRRGLEDLVSKLLLPGDRVALVAPAADVAVVGVLPEAAKQLVTKIETLRGLRTVDRASQPLTDEEALAIHVHSDEAVEQDVAARYAAMRLDPVLVRPHAGAVYGEMRRRVQDLLGTLERTLGWLGGLDGSASVILVSRGFILDASIRELEQTRSAAIRAGVPIHFLDARDMRPHHDAQDLTVQMPPMFYERGDRGGWPYWAASATAASASEALATETGGLVFRHANNVAGGLRRFVEATRSWYVLGYQPTNRLRNGRFRRLRVELTRLVPGVRVTSRLGYFAPPE